MDPNTPLLDLELLNESADFGIDGLRELIDMYMEQADETVAGLQKAIQAGAPGAVMDLAHKLAGSSAVCGLTAMIGPLRTMEKQGRKGCLDGADEVLKKIVENLEISRGLINEYLAEKSR